jgi:hypothetical protein
MMMKERRLRLVLAALLAFSLLAVAPAHGSQEGALKWSSFSIDSEGIGSSGPVSISGKQDATGITAMTIKAFGRTYELGKEHLDKLKSIFMNGMQVSYEGGYKDLGGRTLYIQVSRGFFVSGIASRKFIIVNERGDIAVQEPRTK